jgi:dihydroorotate dehydrogenase (fumarate)
MKKHGVSSLDEVRGKLSMKESEKPELYERLQYIKALVGIE